MHPATLLLSLFTTPILASTASILASTASSPPVPSLAIPACPNQGTVTYTKSLPNLTSFPPTSVNACYSPTALHLTLTAHNETAFFFNASQTTNDPIWQYEVMEAFIARGEGDPQTYLEFEVSPANTTFQAFIYNPSKVRAAGAAFDTFFITQPGADGFRAVTRLDRERKTWKSKVEIPLGLFNVDEGEGRGTRWRMNFFRTVVSSEMFPDQVLGAWSPTNQSSFHMTPFFGRVVLV
ncbi:hypothetical protein B0T22DRAFT_481601 [Podospora appendiculata]|uniref:Carbohydrate-binding domain-containing protein n=1 Tax=Podospora appendiculata TaxID=314037 RepID=A0AAE1CE47_9PEZI|nr:hypothetical protein B0T22DRAFT_481601 [Podospora appendiculata]